MTEFKFANISSNPTVEEIDIEINRLKKLKNDFNNIQMAVKIFINSIYGACASVYFVCYNSDLAEAITLQGQDIIKYSASVLNKYFKEYWHKDTELHQKLGITNPQQIRGDVIVYGDTDSVYCSFEEIVKSSQIDGSVASFILKLNEERLTPYLIRAFDHYSKKWNTENIQDFELETISSAAILLQKKKYVLDIAWEAPNKFYKESEKIKAKGVEIVQSSTPPLARKYIKELLKEFFKHKKDLSLKEFAGKLKELKILFQASDIDNIAFGSSVGDYEKGILNDTSSFEINAHCPMHVRAAGYYNFILNNNKKLKKKYSLIKSGDKVKYYYALDEKQQSTVFAYLPGSFPIEVAPNVDYETQFQKSFIDPLNRFLDAMGYPELSANLIVSKQLF
jgi:hypothetical protein